MDRHRRRRLSSRSRHTSQIPTTCAAPTSHHMAMHSRSSMFAVAEILAANSNRSQMSHEMDTTWWSGSQNNHFLTAKLPCGAGCTQDLINGQRRKNFHRTWRRLFPLQLLIRASIILFPRMSGYATTRNGILSPAAALPRITFSPIKNSGGQNSWMLTKNMSHLNRSIHSLEILP